MGYKCGIHNIDTEDSQVWSKHVAEVSHDTVGITKCKDCGKPDTEVNHSGKIYVGTTIPAYCDECKDRLRKELSI